MKVIKSALQFEGDQGNSEKPKKHGLTLGEIEEAFFDENKIVFDDWKHSGVEQRITLLGKTKKDILLNIVYTVRNDRIMVITARTINKKEVKLYEKAT